MSKGSAQRPYDPGKFAAGWDRAFGKSKKPPRGKLTNAKGYCPRHPAAVLDSRFPCPYCGEMPETKPDA